MAEISQSRFRNFSSASAFKYVGTSSEKKLKYLNSGAKKHRIGRSGCRKRR
jgi:hypothetical protein